jgi:hypothetical protein
VLAVYMGGHSRKWSITSANLETSRDARRGAQTSQIYLLKVADQYKYYSTSKEAYLLQIRLGLNKSETDFIDKHP